MEASLHNRGRPETGMMKTLELNHVALYVTDLKRSTEFYRRVLQLEPIPRPAFTFPGAWLFNYGLMIHIIGRETSNADARGSSGAIQTRDAHLALHADDLGAVEELLQQHGIAYRRNEVPDRKIKQLFFQDPDGFHIEVGTYPPLPPV